jgi:fructose-1,6-bisphosphatase/inositol monophosphatase family enzyme
VNYSQELEFAKTLAREAGKVMYDNFVSGMTKEWKADGTPVTVTDTTINSLVIDRVKEAFPEHSVHGEEEDYNLGSSTVWVCDPVDGTMAFSHGLPISTFSLALVVDGQPVIGVVYDPFMTRLFSAAKGHGAYLNDANIHVSEMTMDHAVIDVEGFPSTHPVLPLGTEFNAALYAAGAKVVSLWSVILPSALIASGEIAATVFNVNKPEDGAAIKVIVEEAGGKVTDLFGEEQRYDQPVKGFVASNGVVHEEILGIIAKLSTPSA